MIKGSKRRAPYKIIRNTIRGDGWWIVDLDDLIVEGHCSRDYARQIVRWLKLGDSYMAGSGFPPRHHRSDQCA